MHRNARFLIVLILLLTLACTFPPYVWLMETPTVAATAAPVEPTPVILDSTATAAPDPTAMVEPSATAGDTPAPQPTTGTPAVPIGLGNVFELVSTQLPLAAPGARILWPPPDLLAELIDPPPNIVAYREAELLPILADPAAVAPALPLPLNGGTVLDFAPDATSLVVQFESGTAVVSPLGPELWAVQQPAAPYSAAYSRDGEVLAFTSPDVWAVTLYHASTGEQINRLTGFETAAPVYAVYPGPGGTTVAWVARGKLQLQDVETGALASPNSFADFISAVAFSPNGSTLYVSAGTQISAIDTTSAEVLVALMLSEPLADLDVSGDGKLLIGAYGASLVAWDAETLAPVASFATGAPLQSVSFSPDQRYITAIDDAGTLWVWRTP